MKETNLMWKGYVLAGLIKRG